MDPAKNVVGWLKGNDQSILPRPADDATVYQGHQDGAADVGKDTSLKTKKSNGLLTEVTVNRVRIAGGCRPNSR